MELKIVFTELLNKYTADTYVVSQLWAEIEMSYTNSKRHYHTLTHLENLLAQLTTVKQDIQDWDTLLFTLFYHDIVYNTLKQNNEEKSADLAVERLQSIGYATDKTEKCKAQILATKHHELSADTDTNLFTDADLSILGADRETYEQYCRDVRREYSIYPDLLYKPGRKKAMQHFLNMEYIFKTVPFSKYEAQARENIAREVKKL